MIAQIAAEAASRFGDRYVLVPEHEPPLSYLQLHQLSDRYAQLLIEHGHGEGSVLALRLPSGIDYVIAYVAAARIGAITAGINPSLADTEQQAVIAALRPDHIVTESNAPRRHLVDTTGPAANRSPGDTPGRTHPDGDDPDRIVAIVYTSGTTGPPKGAVFRNRQLAAISEIDLGPNWQTLWGGGVPMLSSTQFAHVGFMTKLPWYLRLGMTIHVVDRWEASRVLRLIAEHRISTIGAIAPQLALMLRSPEFDSLDLTCVTDIVAGGAASSPALVDEARTRFGAKYSIRYSSTESGGVGLATATDAPNEEALHTVGRPRPGVEVRILDDAGQELGADETGELCLRSAAVFDHYWNDPVTTEATLVDGWLHTGDLASRAIDGVVTLRGRRKEMYIRGGYNVAPAEVEAVLSQHPDVDSIAIAPRPDAVMGEIGVAVVVPRSGSNCPSLEELRDYARPHLARWKLPEAVLSIDSLPLTTAAKVDRPALAAIAQSAPAGSASGPTRHTGHDPVTTIEPNGESEP